MTAIEVARKVVAEKQAHLFRERKDEPGQYDAKPYGERGRGWGRQQASVLDGFTASAICAVYDALKPENQAKFAGLPLVKMAFVTTSAICAVYDALKPENLAGLPLVKMAFHS